MKVRPWGSVERLSHHQREVTPPDFADYLVGEVRLLTGACVVAALYVCKRSPYCYMPGVEPWGVALNADRYAGPWPVVAHPPCGPWGKLAARSRQDVACGQHAMNAVHAFGGVVEQPLGSRLFAAYGRPGAFIERVWQRDFGHTADKQTLLYWYIPTDLKELHPTLRDSKSAS